MRRQLLLLSLIMTPSMLAAQKGKERASNLGDIPQASGPTLRVRDIEDLSPLKLLADKHKDLNLTDDQTNEIKAADKALHAKNQPTFSMIDSLIGVMRSAGFNTSDESQGHERAARGALMIAIDSVNATNAAAAKEELAKLTPDQQSKAQALLNKQIEDGQHTVRQKLGSGRGGGGAR